MRRARRRGGRGATVWLWLQTTLAHCPSDPPLQIAPLIQHTADVYVQLLANKCSVILDYPTSTYDKLNNYLVELCTHSVILKWLIYFTYFAYSIVYSSGCSHWGRVGTKYFQSWFPNRMQIELDLLPDVSARPLFQDKFLLQQFYHWKLSYPPEIKKLSFKRKATKKIYGSIWWCFASSGSLVKLIMN